MGFDITLSRVQRTDVYSAGITYNIREMAKAAGLYEALFRPDEIGVTKAGALIKRLEDGLIDLQQNRTYYKQFNPDNGWGSYVGFKNFVARYLEACRTYPDAEIAIS